MFCSWVAVFGAFVPHALCVNRPRRPSRYARQGPSWNARQRPTRHGTPGYAGPWAPRDAGQRSTGNARQGTTRAYGAWWYAPPGYALTRNAAPRYAASRLVPAAVEALAAADSWAADFGIAASAFVQVVPWAVALQGCLHAAHRQECLLGECLPVA